MNNRPIILRTRRTANPPINLIGVVRIDEAAERALHRLAAETGLSLRAVASSLIVQAAEICAVVEMVDTSDEGGEHRA